MKTFLFATAFALQFLSGPVLADAGTPPGMAARKVLAKELIKVAQVRKVFDNWGVYFTRGNVDECGCFSDEAQKKQMQQAWTTAAKANYDSGRIVADIEDMLMRHFSKAELQRVLDFRRSELGRRITALETHVTDTSENQAAELTKLQAAMASLDARPKRKRLIQELNATAGGARGLASLLKNMQLGVAIGVARTVPDGQLTMSDADLAAAAEQGMAAALPMFEWLTLASYADMYKSLSYQELARFHELATSPVGRRMSGLSLQIFDAHMREQAVRTGERFARELKGQRI